MDQAYQGLRFVVIQAGTLRFKPHKTQEIFGRPAGLQILCTHAEPLQILSRQIDSSPPGIFADIPQNVRQLKGHAAFFSQGQGNRRVEPENMNRAQAHYGCHLIAVAVKLLEIGHVPRRQVRADAFDHLEKIFVWNPVARYRVVKCRPCRIPIKSSAERVNQRGTPAIERIP